MVSIISRFTHTIPNIFHLLWMVNLNMFVSHLVIVKLSSRNVWIIFCNFSRNDKVIVYMDDILIATSSIEKNLSVLKSTMLLFKKYDFFHINFDKCLFLKNSIESWLSTVFRWNYIKQPSHRRNKELSISKDYSWVTARLRLFNYFGRFISDYARIAKLLHDLLHIVASSRTKSTSLDKELQFYQLSDPALWALAQTLEKSEHDKYDRWSCFS